MEKNGRLRFVAGWRAITSHADKQSTRHGYNVTYVMQWRQIGRIYGSARKLGAAYGNQTQFTNITEGRSNPTVYAVTQSCAAHYNRFRNLMANSIAAIPVNSGQGLTLIRCASVDVLSVGGRY